MPELGLNIDHVATLRQARRTYEPDPVWAAVEGQLAGARVITLHLREDRRHVQDHDLERVAAVCQVRLNLEMAATEEMVGIACHAKPTMATLVPEGRLEITTEGGLDIVAQQRELAEAVGRLREAGVRPSAFVDPDIGQIQAAGAAGFEMCELHTGPYARAWHESGGLLDAPPVGLELERLRAAGDAVVGAGMRLNAGHALNYLNIGPVLAIPDLFELHIGHAIISRAVFVGIRQAVAEMVRLIEGR
ncbi:MAG: pyridoxine 5'-phosphate synthase [Phycisphaeraceae bacterium]|nr:pyridoxine 5'-phosphate synthase [Phycisphaeraceae bacterium]